MADNKFKFDFTDLPGVPSSNLKQVQAEKKKLLEGQIAKKSTVNDSNNKNLLIVLLLLTTLVGMGGYLIKETARNKDLIAQNTSEAKVLGAISSNSEEAKLLPIPGFGFSILPDVEPPASFEKTQLASNFEAFPSPNAILTSFIATEFVDGKELRSGVEIYAHEYDNKLNGEGFSQKVLDVLGPDYSLQSNSVFLPKDMRVSKIINQKDLAVSYYSTVTTDNYYLIKIIQETSAYPEFEEINRFTDNILQWIYLN